MRRLGTLLLTLALGIGAGTPARAATIVLNQSTGASYDAVGDGWFFGPLDGVGDLGGNALAVGYIAGTLELRAMAEFPLASLAGLTSGQIASATLTFKIDDVLSTFGPGATFDGTAANPIAVYHYPADGTVTVADFSPPGLSQLAIVDTGTITDATLATSGAVQFDVDATATLKAALTAGDVAFGALFGTLDSPTGTSIDGLSPPGVAGGALPTLTIETVSDDPPVYGKAQLGCQAALAGEGGKVVATMLKGFVTCFTLALKDVAPDATLSPTTATKCAAQLDPTNPASKVAKAVAKFDSKVTAKCTGVAPGDIGSPCNATATGIADVAACVLTHHTAGVEALVRDQYASACSLSLATGLQSAYPGICEP